MEKKKNIKKVIIIGNIGLGSTCTNTTLGGESEQLKCPYCSRLEPCQGSYPEGCFHPKG